MKTTITVLMLLTSTLSFSQDKALSIDDLTPVQFKQPCPEVVYGKEVLLEIPEGSYMRLYNSSGQLVFTTKETGSIILPTDGNYYYIVEKDGYQTYTGHILVID